MNLDNISKTKFKGNIKNKKIEAKFKDKVKAIKKSLKKNDKRLSDKTAQQSAERIAGSMIKNESYNSKDRAKALLDLFNEEYNSLSDMFALSEWAESLASDYDIDNEDMKDEEVIITALNKMSDKDFKEQVDGFIYSLFEDDGLDYLKDTLHVYPRNLGHIIECLNIIKPYASEPNKIDEAIEELNGVNLNLRSTAEEFQKYLYDNYKPWTVLGATSGPRTYIDLFRVPTEYDIVGADYFNYANRPDNMLEHIGYGWKQDGDNIVADLIGFTHSITGSSVVYDQEPVYYGYSAIIDSSNKEEKFKEMAKTLMSKAKEIKEEYKLGENNKTESINESKTIKTEANIATSSVSAVDLKSPIYEVCAYYNDKLRSLEDDLQTDNWSEATEFAHDKLMHGLYVEFKNVHTGKWIALDPDKYIEEFDGEFILRPEDFEDKKEIEETIMEFPTEQEKDEYIKDNNLKINKDYGDKGIYMIDLLNEDIDLSPDIQMVITDGSDVTELDYNNLDFGLGDYYYNGKETGAQIGFAWDEAKHDCAYVDSLFLTVYVGDENDDDLYTPNVYLINLTPNEPFKVTLSENDYKIFLKWKEMCDIDTFVYWNDIDDETFYDDSFDVKTAYNTLSENKKLQEDEETVERPEDIIENESEDENVEQAREDTKTIEDYLNERIGQQLEVGRLNSVLQNIFGMYNKIFILPSDLYNKDLTQSQEIYVVDDGTEYTITYDIVDLEDGIVEITGVDVL